ncbi:MAG TPA: NUDIX hydrolase [Motilibacteraceae bacterium]|nr:NUDIX hydrolase [Motilibacteraceae bacterium]
MSIDPTPTAVDPAMWAALPRKRVAAGLVVLDDAGRVLMVEPTYKPGWEVPGGLVEANESPRAAAAREVREELGVEVEVGRLLVVDYVPAGRRPDDGLMLLYAAGPLDEAAFVLAEEELRSWHWCDRDALLERTTPFMARRVLAGLAALADGAVRELVEGHPA